MRDRVTSHLPRTNNSVEGWHRAFQQPVNIIHPTIYKLCEKFIKEQYHLEILIERYKSGFRRPNCSKSKYVKLNERLKNITTSYGSNNKEELLIILKFKTYMYIRLNVHFSI